ncbi:MAG: hypothetical protein ACREKM_02075 [Longimicrobiales bacterium]
MTIRTARSWIAVLLLTAGIASQATMAACGGSLLTDTASAAAAPAHAGHARPDHAGHAMHAGPISGPGERTVHDPPAVQPGADVELAQASHTSDPAPAPQRCGHMMACGVATPALPGAILAAYPPTDAAAVASISAAAASFLHTAEPPPPRLLLI